MAAAAQIFTPMRFKTIRTAEFAAVQGVRSSSATTLTRYLKYFSSPGIVD